MMMEVETYVHRLWEMLYQGRQHGEPGLGIW
eukprot:COSAG01_NODE_65376_length_273_cov_1.005747_1_plen_30_part_10